MAKFATIEGRLANLESSPRPAPVTDPEEEKKLEIESRAEDLKSFIGSFSSSCIAKRGAFFVFMDEWKRFESLEEKEKMVSGEI